MSIALEADSLALGESKQVYCPYCDNCKPYSPSLSVTRVDTGAVFNCFRASCGAKGYVPVNGAPRLSTRRSDDSISRSKKYDYPLQPITAGFLHTSKEALDEQGVLYNTTLGTLAYPAYNYRGSQFGWVDRSYTGRQPKTINWLDEGVPRVHYPIQPWTTGGKLYIVEDVVSAIRMSKYVNCVSILGTHLDDGQIQDLRSQSSRLVFVLDPDAADKAVKYRHSLQGIFQSVDVMFFPDDPKDMTDEAIKEELGYD